MYKSSQNSTAGVAYMNQGSVADCQERNFPSIMRLETGDYPLLAVAVLLRILAVFVLYWISGGAELSSDVSLLKLELANPFGHLIGTADPRLASYPPLQSLLVFGVSYLPGLFLDQNVAIRLAMIFFEMVSIALFFRIVNGVQTDRIVGLVTKWLLVIAPHQFLLVVAFVQDESISQLLLVAALFCLLQRRTVAAVCCLVAGVLFGKIFFLIPLFYVIVMYPGRVKSLLATLPVFLVYGVVVYMALRVGGTLPLVGFTPGAEYGSTYWVLMLQENLLSAGQAKRISVVVAAVLEGVLLLWLLKRRWLSGSDNPPAVDTVFYMCWPLALFFAIFYQHNPEYLAIFLLPCFLLVRRVSQVLMLNVVALLAWLPNIFFGLANITGGTGSASAARQDVLGGYLPGLEPLLGDLHVFSIIGYSLLLFYLLFMTLNAYMAGASPCSRSLAAETSQ